MLKSIPLWLRLGFLLVVTLSAFLLWKVPAQRTANALERTDAFIVQRDFDSAVKELKALLSRHPGQTKVVLQLARLMRMSDANEAFTLLHYLHEAGRLPDHRYPEAIILGIEVGRIDEAALMLAAIEARAPELPQLVGAKAVKSLADGDLASARQQIEEALALFPEWSALRYIEGQLLRHSPSKVDQLRAKEDLRTVAESDGFEAVRAVFALVDAKNLALSAEEKHAFLGRVIPHPWAAPRFRILAHHYRWQLMPSLREEEVKAAVADLGVTHPVLLAEWMNAIGEHERALSLVPEGGLAVKDPSAFEQRFRALALGGQFEEAEKLVRSSSVGESAVQQAARLFLLSLRPDNSEEALERWNSAYALARSESDIGVQYFLGRSALRLGYLVGAVQAYDNLFKNEEFSNSAAESVWMEYFTVTLATGSIESAHQIVAQAAARFPESLSLTNNQLYIELIAGMEWSATYERFVSLAPPPAEVSDVNGTGSTWVLSSLLGDRAAEALQYLESIESRNPDQAITDSTKIVKALVLAANRRLEEAVRLTEEIDRNNVLPAEWAILGNLRLDP